MKKERKQQVFVAYSPSCFRQSFMDRVHRLEYVWWYRFDRDGFIGRIANDRFYIFFTTVILWGISDVLSGRITPRGEGFLLSYRFHKTVWTVLVNFLSAAFFTGAFAVLLFLVGSGVWPPGAPFLVTAAAVVLSWFFVFWKPKHYKKLLLKELGQICGGMLLQHGEEEK